MLQIIILAVLALSAATGGVAYAANAAEPGDLLYGLDLAIEQMRLDVAFNDEAAAELHLEFAAERLEEAQNRFAEGDFGNAQTALNAYGGEIASLAQLIGSSEGVDQEALMGMVNAAVAVHQDTLTEILTTAPEQAQGAIQGAIDNSNVSVDIPAGHPGDAGQPGDTGQPGDAGQLGDTGQPGSIPGDTITECANSLSEEDAQALVELATEFGVDYEEVLETFCAAETLELVEQILQDKYGTLDGVGAPNDTPPPGGSPVDPPGGRP